MHKQTSAKLVLFNGTRHMRWAALLVLLAFVLLLAPWRVRTATAATSSTINFQARLLQANGAVVADGYYNIEFNLYDVSSGGTTLWTETRYDSNGVSVGNDNRVRVANGYVTVNLGSVNAFPAINWDQELWLTMNVGGTAQTATPTWDGEMSPRLKFTASPYAFAAGKLQVSAGGNTSTLGFGTQTGSRSILLPDESGTICVQGSTGCGFAPTSGSSNYIHNGTSQQTADFNISGNGTIAGRLNLTGTGSSNGIVIGGDTNLYRANTDILATDDAFQGSSYIVAYNGSTNQVTLGRTASGTPGAGITFGSGQDVNLYRSAADTLRTDDALVVSGALSVTSSANSYIMGALGLGTASPQTGSALTITNGTWISAIDAAGTGFINMFQINANNEIQVGAAMNIDGNIILPTNGGQITFSDMPIDSSSAAGTAHSYTMRVGTTNALTVYGQSDGAGGVQNVRVAIGSGIAPGYVLDVTGDINSTTALRVGGTSVCTASGCTPASGSANYIQNTTTQQASSNFNISGSGTIGTTLNVNGSTVATTATTMNLFNTTATTLNFGGAATAINVGAAAGTATFNGKVSVGAGTVAARLAVTATNNSDAALWAQTTNAAGYGAALRVGTATVDYLNISNFGKWVVRNPSGADNTDQYLFQDSGSNNIIGFGIFSGSRRVYINSTAAGASAHALYVNGDANLSVGSVYRINGTQISSANLSNDSSLAKLNATNTVTSTSAFVVTNGTTNGIVIDTSNNRVGIGTTGAPGAYALDVAGIFQVDRTNNRIIVGTSGGSTTGVVTVLGNKTNAGDPTGVVGAMYFNSSLNSFRCYTSATTGWQDCGPQTRKLTADATNSTTTMGDISGLGFAVAANTDYTLKCTLLYQSVATTTGFVVSLDGPASPTAVSGMLSTYNGTNLDTPVGYGFTAYDGGNGVASVTAANTSYTATLHATFRNGSTAGNLIPRLKSLVGASQVSIMAGSSCQLTSL